MVEQLKPVDFATGIGKSVVFGLLIGLIACTNGLKVTGGAAGVGKATTGTVVQSVVAIIIADLIFTAVFYAWEARLTPDGAEPLGLAAVTMGCSSIAYSSRSTVMPRKPAADSEPRTIASETYPAPSSQATP